MSNKFKPLWAICTGLMVSPAAMAVDLIGVHDLALKSDPRLQAAEYRRQATAENKTQAWANLLPQLGATGSWSKGNTKTTIPDIEACNVSEFIEYNLEEESFPLPWKRSQFLLQAIGTCTIFTMKACDTAKSRGEIEDLFSDMKTLFYLDSDITRRAWQPAMDKWPTKIGLENWAKDNLGQQSKSEDK